MKKYALAALAALTLGGAVLASQPADARVCWSNGFRTVCRGPVFVHPYFHRYWAPGWGWGWRY